MKKTSNPLITACALAIVVLATSSCMSRAGITPNWLGDFEKVFGTYPTDRALLTQCGEKMVKQAEECKGTPPDLPRPFISYVFPMQDLEEILEFNYMFFDVIHELTSVAPLKAIEFSDRYRKILADNNQELPKPWCDEDVRAAALSQLWQKNMYADYERIAPSKIEQDRAKKNLDALYNGLVTLAAVYINQGKNDQGEKTLKQGLDVARQIAREQPSQTQFLDDALVRLEDFYGRVSNNQTERKRMQQELSELRKRKSGTK